MKIAILGSSGHFRLATERSRIEAAVASQPDGKGSRGGAGEVLEFLLAPVGQREDMGPVASSLTGPGGRLSLGNGGGATGAGTSAGRLPRIYDDWRRLLDEECPDIAVVNPPFNRIGGVARECLERGIHVFAEKPLATAWEDYEALRAAIRPHGPRLMAMLTLRYDGIYRAARRALEDARLGRPVLLSAQKSYPLQGWDGAPRPDFYRTRKTYGGTLPWIGIHVLDLLRWFSGSEFASVGAAHTTLGNGGHGEMESAAAMHLTLDSGAVAAAHVDFLRRRNGGPELPGGQGKAANRGLGNVQVSWGDDRLRVACEGGVLEIAGGVVSIEGPDGPLEVPPDPDVSMFDAFLSWSAGKGAMDLSTDDCLKATEAALRARDAADSGRVQAF